MHDGHFSLSYGSPIHSAGICLLIQPAVVHYGIPEPESAGEVVGFIAVSRENPRRNITAESALADHINRLSFFHFVQPFSEFIHRDVDKVLDVSPAVFADCTGVQQRYASVTGQFCGIVDVPRFSVPFAMLSIIKPAMFTGSLAEEYGGA